MKIGLTLSIFLLIVLVGCKREPSPSVKDANPASITASSATAMTRDVPASFDESGSFVADESSNITPPVAGRIIATPIDEGSFVKEGRVIAELDHRDAKFRLQRAQAQLEGPPLLSIRRR